MILVGIRQITCNNNKILLWEIFVYLINIEKKNKRPTINKIFVLQPLIQKVQKKKRESYVFNIPLPCWNQCTFYTDIVFLFKNSLLYFFDWNPLLQFFMEQCLLPWHHFVLDTRYKQKKKIYGTQTLVVTKIGEKYLVLHWMLSNKYWIDRFCFSSSLI